MDAEEFGGFGLISFGPAESALDELSFELVDGFAEVDALFDHFRHKRFQLLFHNFFLRVDFFLFLLLLPPALQRTVADEEFRFQLIGRYYSDRPRTRQEVRRKL